MAQAEKRPSILVMLGLVLTLGLTSLAVAGCKRETPDAGVTLRGTGATFPAPLYERWTLKYAVRSKVKVHYDAAGSGAGVQAIMLDNVDFAASDSPMTDDELTQAGDVLHIPMTLGAVAIVYNYPGAKKGLHLDGQTLAAIYTGDITKWNDPALAQLNPGRELPDLPIVTVARSDGSGTTKVVTEYLSQLVPAFKEKIGSRFTPDWKPSKTVRGNTGVSAMVKRTKGSIGYIALNYARADRHEIADIRNRTGAFVAPTLDSMTAAAAGAAGKAPEDLRFYIVNAEGEDAYPLSTFSFMIVRRKQSDANKGAALGRFLMWGLNDGQRYAPMLSYGTLPPEIVTKAEALVQKMEAGGQPIPVEG